MSEVAPIILERMQREGLHFTGQSIEFASGVNDGITFYEVYTPEGQVFHISDAEEHPGQYRSVLVPVEFQHPSLIE